MNRRDWTGLALVLLAAVAWLVGLVFVEPVAADGGTVPVATNARVLYAYPGGRAQCPFAVTNTDGGITSVVGMVYCDGGSSFASASTSNCTTVYDCDFTQQPWQYFTSAATPTVCNLKLNVTPGSSYTADAGITDAGFQMFPASSTAYDLGNNTFSAPYVRIGFSALGISPLKQTRITIWGGITNFGSSSDSQLLVGVEHVGVSSIGDYLSIGNISGSKAEYLTQQFGPSYRSIGGAYTSEDVFEIVVDPMFRDSVSYRGTYDGGFQDVDSMDPNVAINYLYFYDYWPYGYMPTKQNSDLFFTVVNWVSSVGNVAGTVKRLKVETCY